MASTVPHRLVASVIDKIRREKEERLRQEWESHRAGADEAEAKERQDAFFATLTKQKQTERDRAALDEEEKLKDRSGGSRAAQAADEARVDALRRRLQDFRGTDDHSMRDRLLSEGFSEALTEEQLRLRTIDQRVGNEFGMRAAFADGSGRAGMPQSLDAALGGASRANSTGERPGEPQYLRSDEPEGLYKNELPEAVRGAQGPSGSYHDKRDLDKEDGVRKGLGLGDNSFYNS